MSRERGEKEVLDDSTPPYGAFVNKLRTQFVYCRRLHVQLAPVRTHFFNDGESNHALWCMLDLLNIYFARQPPPPPPSFPVWTLGDALGTWCWTLLSDLQVSSSNISRIPEWCLAVAGTWEGYLRRDTWRSGQVSDVGRRAWVVNSSSPNSSHGYSSPSFLCHGVEQTRCYARGFFWRRFRCARLAVVLALFQGMRCPQWQAGGQVHRERFLFVRLRVAALYCAAARTARQQAGRSGCPGNGKAFCPGRPADTQWHMHDHSQLQRGIDWRHRSLSLSLSIYLSFSLSVLLLTKVTHAQYWMRFL